MTKKLGCWIPDSLQPIRAHLPPSASPQPGRDEAIGGCSADAHQLPAAHSLFLARLDSTTSTATAPRYPSTNLHQLLSEPRHPTCSATRSVVSLSSVSRESGLPPCAVVQYSLLHCCSTRLPPYPYTTTMVLGRLTHYALDIVLVSAVVAGVKRSTGFQ